MSDMLGVLYYTEAHMKEVTDGYTAIINAEAEVHDKEIAEVRLARDALRATLRQVVACFKSRTESSTCIEDHHPSCLAFIEARIKKYNREGV